MAEKPVPRPRKAPAKKAAPAKPTAPEQPPPLTIESLVVEPLSVFGADAQHFYARKDGEVVRTRLRRDLLAPPAPFTRVSIPPSTINDQAALFMVARRVEARDDLDWEVYGAEPPGSVTRIATLAWLGEAMPAFAETLTETLTETETETETQEVPE